MDWQPIIDRVVPTPEEYQRFLPPSTVRSVLRCSSGDLLSLAQAYAGVTDTDAVNFDAFDVWNIGLRSGSGRSRPELEMLYFRRLVLSRPGWTLPDQLVLSFRGECLNRDCDSADWTPPQVLGAEWLKTETQPGAATWTAQVATQGARDVIRSEPARQVWQELTGRYRYQYNNPVLETVLDASLRRQVGSCTALSAVLHHQLNKVEVRSRIRQGYLWGGLMAREHHWVELQDTDGRWKPMDLSMAILARDFFTREYEEFCLGSMLNRVVPVAEGTAATAVHQCGGRALPISLLVSAPA